jgi:hypothetical protein
MGGNSDASVVFAPLAPRPPTRSTEKRICGRGRGLASRGRKDQENRRSIASWATLAKTAIGTTSVDGVTVSSCIKCSRIPRSNRLSAITCEISATTIPAVFARLSRPDPLVKRAAGGYPEWFGPAPWNSERRWPSLGGASLEQCRKQDACFRAYPYFSPCPGHNLP